MWSLNLWSRVLKILMISSSVNSSDTTGTLKSMIVRSNRPILVSGMVTSILEMDPDWLLLLLLTNAILLLLLLNICNLVAILLVQQVQERQRQLKILLKLWQYSVWSSTVQMVLIIGLWEDFSVVWLKEEPGLVSTSSIESILKCSVWLLSRFLLSNRLSKEMTFNLSLKPELFLSAIDLACLSLWIQDMLVVHNFLTTWNLFSDQWLWWFLIMHSSPRSFSFLKVSRQPNL